MKHEPRSAPDSLSPQGRNRGIAAVALLGGCALLTLLLVRVTDGSIQTSKDPFVTVTRAPIAGPAAHLVGGAEGSRPRGETLGRRFGESMVLAPRMIDGRLAGYVIMAQTDGAALLASKLRAGDLLIELDRRPLDPSRVQALGDELSNADSIEVTYLRDGQIRQRLIDLDR